MAWVLAGMVGHIGQRDDPQRRHLGAVRLGLASSSPRCGQQRLRRAALRLTAIDAGHWLAVLVLMGVVIGWMGV